MSKKDDFFKRLDALLKAEAWTPESVGTVLGVKRAFKKASETPYFVVYRSAGSKGSPIGDIEVRVKRDNFRGGMVLFAVDPAMNVWSADVLGRFGKDPFISAPSAHSPKETPTYFIYSNPGGEIRFGLRLGKPALLTQVVVDRGASIQDGFTPDESTSKDALYSKIDSVVGLNTIETASVAKALGPGQLGPAKASPAAERAAADARGRRPGPSLSPDPPSR